MSVDAAALHAVKVGILDSIQTRLASSLGGKVDRACVVPGASIAWDDCECGQLTVHQGGMWPSQTFPAPVEQGRANCATPWWAVTIIVTLLRCSPTGQNSDAPTCEALTQTAITVTSDMEVMQRGTICALADSTYRLQDHVPTPDDGMCVGSELTVIVAVPNCKDEC